MEKVKELEWNRNPQTVHPQTVHMDYNQYNWNQTLMTLINQSNSILYQKISDEINNGGGYKVMPETKLVASINDRPLFNTLAYYDDKLQVLSNNYSVEFSPCIDDNVIFVKRENYYVEIILKD